MYDVLTDSDGRVDIIEYKIRNVYAGRVWEVILLYSVPAEILSRPAL